MTELLCKIKDRTISEQSSESKGQKGISRHKLYKKYSSDSDYFTNFYSKTVQIEVVLFNNFRKPEIRKQTSVKNLLKI